MAVGILSIGMLFIAGTFPTGLHLSTVAAERSIAAVAAEEAFTKIRLYGVDMAAINANWTAGFCADYNNVSPVLINLNEFEYPSTTVQKKYYWRALCRKINADPLDTQVQVTVFVCRRSGTGSGQGLAAVAVAREPAANELEIDAGQKSLINDGDTIVDSETGQIYRILERYAAPNDRVINLDRPWGGGSVGEFHLGGSPADWWKKPLYRCVSKSNRFLSMCGECREF